MGKIKTLSFSVLLVISVLWKPALSDKCSIACQGSPTAPTFLNGHKYNYAVEGTVSIYLTGADKQETSVRLLAQVSVASLGNCVNQLKVQNLVISGPDGKKYGSPPGIDKAVRFTLQDGRVGAEICAEDGDTRRSLNIKRAIISLLQSETKPSTQVDVFGSCPTDASSSQEGPAVLVHRSRDLNHCGYREQAKNDLLAGYYNPTAEIKNTQVLQSMLNVESKVNNGIPEKVSATEEYLYRPFSVGENGARAKVHTKMTLTGKAAGAPEPSQCEQSRSIIFENPHGAASSAGNFASALAAVKDTAKTLGSEASSKSAGEFAQLVRVLRSANHDDLMKIYGQVKGNNLEKRVFLDGLIRTGTGQSIEASIDLLKKKELSQLETILVLLSLGNARHTNNEALKSAASLLDMPDMPKEVYLGVGALAGSYCKDFNCHLSQSDGIKTLSTKLASKLQNCKPKNKIEEDRVVAVLKGIRSIRHLEDVLVDKVVRCATDNSVKSRVRVAAIEAFGADPCDKTVKKTSLDIMKNRQLDSELRIKAYLSVITCPTAESASEIKKLLETEPVHQVGHFITTSLRHIRASSNPEKNLAKLHYGQIRTPNRFNVDDRKYSFYREMSYNVDALGLGGNMEQTLIYSQDSFLPRSGSLNLTAEVFGHTLNILEVGGRQGNLDRVVEHFLGPKSFLRTQNPQELYDDIVKRFKEAEQQVGSGLKRGVRSVKSEVDNFDKHVKAESAPFNNELDVDISMRIFGSDAVFLSLGDGNGLDMNNILNKLISSVNGGVDKLKHFKQEIRAHLLFIDAELAYPTSTGLPLKLDLVGSATGRLEVATNIDLRQIYRNPKDAKVDVKLVPSTDVQLSGQFLVDADAVATGLKVVTNLHSSTGGHLIAKVLENGNGIDLQFALPIEKQEIVTASNDLIYFTAEKGQKEKHIALKVDTDRKEYNGCFDQLSGLLGLTLCGELSVPFSVSGQDAQASISKFLARYPLTGPSRLKLVVEKNDLRGYHVKAVVRNDNPSKRGFELLFEAEGSQNRRTQLTGELISNNDENTIKLALESPIKSVYGQVSYITKPNERVLLLKAKMDAIEYYAKAGFLVQGNDNRSVFKPILEYQLPDDKGKQTLKVDGQLIREVNGPVTKYSLEGIKITLPNSNEIVDLNGHLNQEPKGYDLDLKAKKGEYNMLLSGSLKGGDYKLEFQNTLNPFVNFRLIGYFLAGETGYHNDIDLCYGNDLNNKQNRVTLNQLFKYHSKSSEDFSLMTKNKFEIYAVPIKVKADAEVDPKKFDIELEGQYLDKKAEFDIEARTHIKKRGDYSVKVNAEINNRGLEVFAKRDIVSADKSNLENYIDLKGVGKYELSGVVLHKTKPNDLNVGAIGHLKVSGGGKNEDIKFDIGVIENANLYSSHAKISGSKGDLVDYLLKITRGANANGQLKFVLKDTIAANGNFKVTDNDGKGNGVVIVDFKKSQRKFKGDFKFVVKDPVYNAEMDLFLNFEKDNNDKVHIKTNTKRTAKSFDSKNSLEYGGKKTEVNVHQDGEDFTSGKSHAKVEVVLPTERCLTLKVDQDINYKDDQYIKMCLMVRESYITGVDPDQYILPPKFTQQYIKMCLMVRESYITGVDPDQYILPPKFTQIANGHTSYVLSDSVKRGGPSSVASLTTKVVNTNLEKETINVESKLEIKLKDGRNLQGIVYLKNVPEGEKFKYDIKAEATGSLMPAPASITAQGTSLGSTKEVEEKYNIKGSYGDKLGFQYSGMWEMKFSEKGDGKYVDDSTLTLRLPLDVHDIKYVSTVILVNPENPEVIGEYTFVQSVQVNADLYKIDASGKAAMKDGFGKVKVIWPHVDPMILDVNYKADPEQKKGSVQIKSQYGKGKSASVNMAAQVEPEYVFQLQATSPQNEKNVLGFSVLDFEVKGKESAPGSYSSSAFLDADGKKYSYNAVVVYSKVQPLVDIKLQCPNNQNSRVFFKGTSLSSTQGKIDAKLENINGISFDGSSEANVQKDNVVLKIVANSDKLGLKNYKIDISSKDAGSGKRLEFHAVNDNKNVLSGSTSFISKQEGPKTIIEGSGSVKVKDQQKSANFKYIRTLLTEGNEQGVETFLNLAIGERSYVAESRVTNLEYKNSYVYCEEKKQCANAEVQSKLHIPKPGVFQHSVNVGFDLRKLGFAPEFGLEILNEVSEKKLPQFGLDLHINKDDKKYYLHAYSKPEHGRFPAGITITLPQRVLSLESLISYPTNKGLPFPIRGEVALHLDKNKPKQKTAARFLVDFTQAQNDQAASAEFGFSHPSLGKEALVKFRGKLQRPNPNTIKIETAASASCTDRESKLYLEVSPVLFKFLVDTPVVQVIDLEASATLKDNLQQGDLRFSLLQGKPVQVRLLVKDYQYYEYSTGYSDESERRLSVIGHIQPEKRIDISADILLDKEKKNIFHGALYLKDNAVKSDYGVSKDNFNYFVTALQKGLQTLEQRVKQLGEKASNEFKSTMQRVEPQMKKLQQAYKEDAEKLYHELVNDKALQEISKELEGLFKILAKMIDDVVQATKPFADNIAKTVSEVSKKVMEIYEKQLEPQFKQIYANLASVIKEYFEGLLDLVAHVAALASDFFEKHKPELQELSNTIAEIFKDLTRLLVAHLKEFRGKAAQIFSDACQQIKELPLFGMIEEQWKSLSVSDNVVRILNEFHNTIKSVLPTEETKAFADVLNKYVQKKLRQEKCDDTAELRVVYEKFALALTSLVQFVRTQLNQYGVPSLININALPLLSGPGQASMPSFGGIPSLSILNQLLKGDFPDPLQLIRAYRPRDLNPLNEIPAKLRAVVINGQHIFTFDGRHLTFPGTCRYVLAHDHVDRNFTLIMQLQNGAPKALILEDQSGTTIELKENGQVALNGAVHGYPVIEKDIFAFRETNGRIGVGSKYGLMVFCTSKLEVCYIEVNGFYLGKLRGLLGDGNNEPYDDFRMPNGKITNSESDFGNAYRLASSCAVVKTPEHNHHQMHMALPPACETVFGGNSPLRPLALMLDVTPFRQACIHACSGDAADALHQACDLGRGYAALAVTGLLPAILPEECVQCTDTDKPKNVGDTYELKLPNKQADIVVAVETTKDNSNNYKDLAVPLLSQLVDTLKSKHINDIKVYLVGITSKMPYSIVYDTDLKLRSPKVQFVDESRYQHTPTIKTTFAQIDKTQEILADIVDSIRNGLGLTNVVAGYQSLMDLPLRPGAVKHTINVVGSRCHGQFLLLEVLRSLAYNTMFEQMAYSHTLITVTPELKVGNGKNPSQIVGYTKDAVLMLGDKKQGKEAQALRSTLEVEEHDSCIDFVESTDGLVLSANNFFALNPGQRKQFLQTSTVAITNKLLGETILQSCTCAYVDPFRVRSICFNEQRKEVARRRK